ncbi:mannose-1-phosphate guanylyltransferase/mannose-6-phosphate isomerase [Nitratiruptor sp. YY09-18]|uniref:mannose-1-phosphate guanylyltransferase/mannose-6-phosphate isomerase n=1 Tax=Nitratiruptor sp. YY09-18 TaxID=2724901 RepID=UPI001915C7CB|nr:mannose-1-phosphate guanylyltransferase/mannose-6-phosphate isomerase [Nitratiruptor sp. YY09-18]BCD67945.1 mannose-1-phosphate guanylyltransferase [Nitratiruptor sp. YY09-18]
MINIILSGGSGTRLWPLSRKLMPKQFLQLFDNKSLFQKTLQRNALLSDKILIISNEEQYFLANDQVDEIGIDPDGYILEPFGRNTAAAIAFGAMSVDEDELLFITPSDHLIEDEEKYHEAVQRAKDLAQNGGLVTFGIKPTEPHSGYGYIEANGEDVVKFHEKPDKQKAKEYLSKGNYYWNSGMFLFKAGIYLEELQKYAPELYESAKMAYENSKVDGKIRRITPEFMEKIPDISIDYAVMEKSDKIKMVPSNFQWSDVGSFDSLTDHIDNKTDNIEIESKNTFYYSDNDKKLIATIGIEDLIIIDTNDALLIAKKGETQKVKELIGKLQTSHPELLNAHTKVHRPWGTYEVLVEDSGYKIKRIEVKPGKRLSLQKHFHRNEHWIVVSGTAEVQVGDERYLVRANESTYIKMGEIHRLSNPGKIPVILIEAQVGEYTGEDDIVRIEDDYVRKY